MYSLTILEIFNILHDYMCCAIGQEDRCWLLTEESWVQYWVISSVICGRQSGSQAYIPQSSSVFIPCYHNSIAPWPSITALPDVPQS
jgi:hypothetical protein